jgi:hypothetical protein
LAAAAPSGQPDVRIVAGDGLVAGSVGGHPASIRIDPGATATPILDAGFAARAGLAVIGTRLAATIGPERIIGQFAVVPVDLGRGPVVRGVGWYSRRFDEDADVSVGPGGVPEAVVRFVLRPPLPAERTAALPLFQGTNGGATARIVIGGAPMAVRFDPRNPHSLVAAAAAARLAAALGGAFEGPTASATITFGVARPVRPMRLGRPLLIGPLAVSRLLVRTGDTGAATGIADPEADPDEVVVTGGRPADPRRDRLILGADALASCSVIEFDKRARQVRLTCA